MREVIITPEGKVWKHMRYEEEIETVWDELENSITVGFVENVRDGAVMLVHPDARFYALFDTDGSALSSCVVAEGAISMAFDANDRSPWPHRVADYDILAKEIEATLEIRDRWPFAETPKPEHSLNRPAGPAL